MTTPGSDSGFREELRWEKVPDGARRSRSTGTPGYERDLLRDSSGKLLGPTESRPATIDEIFKTSGRGASGTDFRQQIAQSVIEVTVTALTPYVERAIQYGVDSGVDGVVRLVKWAKRKAAESKSTAAVPDVHDSSEVLEAEIVDDDAIAGDELARASPPITGEEYRARFLAALAAERYAFEEKRRLAEVNVVDDALTPELKAALHAALASPASQLDDETLAVVVEFLDGSRTSDGQYLLLGPAEAETPQRELDSGTPEPPNES